MISNESETATDSHTTGAATLPGGIPALRPETVSPACRIIWRGPRPSGNDTQQDGLQETLGYVVEGRAVLEIDGQKLILEPGDCVIMPKGARRLVSIVEPLTIIESPMMPHRPGGGRS